MAGFLGVLGAIAAIAKKAITWLKRAGDWVDDHDTQLKLIGSILAQNKHLTKYVGLFFEKMQWVEATVGAHTNAWSLLVKAKKAGTGVTLPAAEVAYLYEFKKVFDKTIKKLGTDKKIAKSSKVLTARVTEYKKEAVKISDTHARAVTRTAANFRVTSNIKKRR